MILMQSLISNPIYGTPSIIRSDYSQLFKIRFIIDTQGHIKGNLLIEQSPVSITIAFVDAVGG